MSMICYYFYYYYYNHSQQEKTKQRGGKIMFSEDEQKIPVSNYQLTVEFSCGDVIIKYLNSNNPAMNKYFQCLFIVSN